MNSPPPPPRPPKITPSKIQGENERRSSASTAASHLETKAKLKANPKLKTYVKSSKAAGRTQHSASQEVGISITGLTKRFTTLGKTITIVEDLDLELPAGNVIAIIGASGSGKSTFLNLLSGLDKSDAGSIELLGRDITKMKERHLAQLRNDDIGFIFQQHYLIGELTVLENILLPAQIFHRRLPKGTLEWALELLERIRLSERRDHLIGELSGGEMQRAAIARALINKPTVVMADEPTGDLDKQNALDVFELLQELSADSSSMIVMVTHDLTLAEKADLVYEISDQTLNQVRIRRT